MKRLWKQKDWERFLPKLEQLNRNQLAQLANKTGVIFDEPQKITKEEYLLVLDETEPRELIAEYNKIREKQK